MKKHYLAFILVVLIVGCMDENKLSDSEIDELVKRAYEEDVRNAVPSEERLDNILEPLSTAHDSEKILPVYLREMDSINFLNARFAVKHVMHYKDDIRVKEKYIEMLSSDSSKINYLVWKEMIPITLQFNDKQFIHILVKNLGVDKGTFGGESMGRKSMIQKLTFDTLIKYSKTYGTEEVGNSLVAELKEIIDFQEEKMKIEGILFTLGELRNKEYIPVLVEYSNHELDWVRAFAISNLAVFMDTKLFELFVSKLDDESVIVQREAVFALNELKDKRAVGPFINAITGSQHTSVAEMAAHSLVQFEPVDFSEYQENKAVDFIVTLENNFDYEFNPNDFNYFRQLSKRNYERELAGIKDILDDDSFQLKNYYVLNNINLNDFASRTELLEEAKERLDKQDYFERIPFNLRVLDHIDLIRLKILLDMLEKEEFRNTIGEQIMQDVEDTKTEHGGILYLNNNNIQIREFGATNITQYFEGKISADDLYYINSEKLLSEMAYSLMSYHFHANTFNMTALNKYPSSHDYNTRKRLQNDDLIIISIDKGEFSITIHWEDGFILDIGVFDYEVS